MLREITTPSDAAMVILASVAEMFERAVTFFVRPSEMIGERAVGVSSEKSAGPIQGGQAEDSDLKTFGLPGCARKGTGILRRERR